MKINFAIVTAFLLLNFVAFAQIPSDKFLRIGVKSLSETNFSGTVSNTEPDITYEIQRKQGQAGWVSVGFILGSETTNWTPFDFKISGGINPKTFFRVKSWIDSQGVGIPDWWQLKYFGTVGIDPYANPAGDGWNNLQKFQNETDPATWHEPPKPVFDVKFYGDGSNPRKGKAILSWQCQNGTIPDYFLIERANRTQRPMTNDSRFMRPGSYGINGRFPTNLPPNFRPMYGRPDWRHEAPLITGPFELVARIPGQPGMRDYCYVETNIDTLFQPIYRMQPHYSPPPQVRPAQVSAAAIRKTILSVKAQQTTNGYDLTVMHPIAYGSYLLLVRDKNDPQWRASGYFTSGTNRSSVHLHVNAKGMMSDGQSPIAMPVVKFLPDVVKPEFTAGWGEDNDSDGLPDIYEVLVTHTDPDNADTGNTGILDGDKEMTGDGWSNLEKFRLRVDPLQPAHPPAPVDLKQPTGLEIMQAMTPKTDLGCELQIEVRTNGATSYQPVEQVPWMLCKIINFRQPNDHRDFDMRISWRFAQIQPRQDGGRSSWGAPAFYKAIEPLMERINFQLAEAFKANLATNPPLSRNDTSNMMAAIEHAYRQGELDKGVAMAEMMTLADNQSQDFYGKIIDQYGQPVAGADVALNINLDFGRGGSQKTQTDADGLFKFIGIRGRSLNIVPEKKGFQIEGHGLGLKGVNGPETSLSNREVYTMWKLKGPEPMIHDQKRYNFKPDNRIYTIDLLSKKMAEGTNDIGDFLVQIQRPPQIKPRENFEWSFTMTAIGGGLIEVTNDDYVNEAPAKGYQPQYKLNMTPANPKWRGWNGEETFYLKSRDGKVYGHFHIRIDPVSRDGSSLEIESYVNPAGSRNLEFDSSKQTEYIPKVQTVAPLPPPVTPKTSLIVSTNVSGQIVGLGSIVLPLVNPRTRFIAVAAGGEHSLALKADGTVVAWGRNLSGEATVSAGLSNVIAIAAGGRSGSGFSLALKRDGRVVAWGDNAHLQTSVPNGLSNVVSIAAGTEHCLALKKDGTIIGWGINEEGRTQSPVGLSNVVAVSAGEEHSMALKSDGTVVAWGRNQHGQANVPEGLSNVVSICSGSYFNLALKKDGTVVGWGIDMPKDLTNITTIAAGPWDGMALRRDGRPVVWGQSYFSATQVPSGLSNIVAISSGGNDYGDHNLALRQDGTIVGWGNNNYGQSLSPDSLTDIVSIAGGLGHYLAIRADGSVVGWGGEDHQGDGQAWVPTGLGPVSHVAGGWYHSLAVRSDGTVAGWGFGAFGHK